MDFHQLLLRPNTLSLFPCTFWYSSRGLQSPVDERRRTRNNNSQLCTRMHISISSRFVPKFTVKVRFGYFIDRISRRDQYVIETVYDRTTYY